MSLCFYVTLLTVWICVTHIHAKEVLQVDGEAEKEAVANLIREHADYAAIEAILGKEPDKQEECDKEKNEYADELEAFLKTKGKEVEDVEYIKISTEEYPLPVFTKGPKCEVRKSGDGMYWYKKDFVNDIIQKAKAAHQDPQKALEEFKESPQYKNVLDSLKYIQEQEGVKNMLSQGQTLHQIGVAWINSLYIPGLTRTPKAEAKTESENKEGY